MENQHRKIKGYNELDQDTIDLINKIKLHGVVLAELHDEVVEHIKHRWSVTTEPEAVAQRTAATPERFAALAKTEFQTALMYLTRSVACPSTF